MTIDLVTTSTAAFIADLSDKDMQRVVDEEIVVAPLANKGPGPRSFAIVTTALAKFYFDAAPEMTRPARVHTIRVIVERITKRKDADAIFALKGPFNDVDWSVKLTALDVHLVSFIHSAHARDVLVKRAESSIVEDSDVLGGKPVFKGTRVPVATVLASREAGIGMNRLVEAYPFLTEGLVQDAQTYVKIHPKVGRPAKARPSAAKLVSSKQVTLPSRQ